MKVLVAEDDVTSRMTLEGVLKKWNYCPILACDGKEAWEILQQEDAPELVILDRVMPGMDGLEVLRRAREMNGPYPPYVILLTARDKKVDIVKGLEAGGNDYISKPYDAAELKARLRVGHRMVDLQNELARAHERLAHQAMHDALTGILNRPAILELFRKEVARAHRENSCLGVGMCDIDHFKRVNDSYGHQVGDEVLTGVAKRLQKNLREYDELGRYGGEEFLIIAPGTSALAQKELYERLRACIAEKTMSTEAGPVEVTVSFGITHGYGNRSPESLLSAADSALYRAKDAGRNCVRYEPADPPQKVEADNHKMPVAATAMSGASQDS